MRLSAPTNRTFSIAALLAFGVISRPGYLGDVLSGNQTYWLTASGGQLLTIGSPLNKL